MAVYKEFPNRNLIRDWGELLKLSKEEVVDLYENWKIIDKENSELNKKMYDEKHAKITEVADSLKLQGIDVYKYKKRGFSTQKNGYQAWFKNNVVDVISKKYPYYSSGIPTAHMMTLEVNGISLQNNQSPTTIVQLHEKLTRDYSYKIKEANKKDKLLIKSIEYANEHNIDINEISSEDIIHTVLEYASEKYLIENYPEGSEVYLKHPCDSCSTYYVGERRCSCGNRRIYMQVEGNILDGFYAYPEAY